MENNFSKKSLALLIALAVILSSFMTGFGVVANAATTELDVWDGTIATEYAGGTGTASDPFQIATPEQLALMALGTTYVNTEAKYYELTADIYLNNTNDADWMNNSPNQWLKAKTDTNYFFNGSFNGNGHTINGLYVSGNFERMGLFPGVIGNVYIQNTVITDSYFGATGTAGKYIGAFVGLMYKDATNVNFSNCYVDESVTVIGEHSVAGFVGSGACSFVNFKNCASFASVTNNSTQYTRYGSFIGGLSSGTRQVKYDNCIGNIAYTTYIQYPTYTASYCAVSGSADTGSTGAAPAVVALENMKGTSAKTNMPDLNWKLWKTTVSYPVINFVTDAWDGTVASGFAGGTGTAEDPFQIATPSQLALMAFGTNYTGKTASYYKLTADINVNDTTDADWINNNPNKWLTSKTDTAYFFNGHFDGDGHTIKGLYVSGDFERMGLFPGVTGTAYIQNVIISDSYFCGTGTAGKYIGAFVGLMYRDSTTLNFENCYVDESVTVIGEHSVAGFVGAGACTNLIFKNCASFASVTNNSTTYTRYGSFVGGLSSGNRQVKYDNCIGNIAYTTYIQYPTYTAAYCAVEGSADTGNTGAEPAVVALENMKGTAAETNMPNLNWVAWKTTDNFPVLTFEKEVVVGVDVWDGTIALSYEGGSGTADSPYLISTPEQLALMVTTSGADTAGKYYKLTGDMYLNDTTDPDWKNNSPLNWCAPEKDNYFRGNFDGNGYTVYGLYYNGSKPDAGLFAGIRSQSVAVKNLKISDAQIITTANYAGALAGMIFKSTAAVIENCVIDSNVTVTAANYSGGFIGGGTCASILFKNCASFATVAKTVKYGSFVGGLDYNNGDGDARKITYDSCMANIVYTNYAQYPTYIASYCAESGTVDSSKKGLAPIVVSLSDMQGATAKDNMPLLSWNDDWFTTDSYPTPFGTPVDCEHTYSSDCDYNCDTCGAHRENGVEHTYESVTVDATCTENGKTVYTCSLCGHSYSKVILAAHKDEDNNAVCDICDADLSDTHKHTYKSVVTEPDCENAGYTTYTCPCGDTYTSDEIEANGHVEVTAPAVEPTAGKTGLTEGKYCGICGEVIVEQQVLPTVTSGKTGDCNWSISGTTLTISGNGAMADNYIPWDVTITEIIIENGVTYIGETVFAETDIISIVIPESVTKIGEDAFFGCDKLVTVDLPAGIETIGNGAFAGCTSIVTVNYDGSEEDKVLIAIGFDNEALTNATWNYKEAPHECEFVETERIDATCTENGKVVYSCTCGESYEEPIEAKGHTEVVDNAVAATNTTNGLTEGKHCSVCEEVLVAQKLIPATLAFQNASLTLENNICVNYKLPKVYADTYDKLYIAYEFEGKSYIIDEYKVDGETIIFSFDKVAANMMTADIYAVIYGEYEGETYQSVRNTYSVLKYASTALQYMAAYPKVMKTVVSLLNYGTAAQVYTSKNLDKLANSILTEEMQNTYATAEHRETNKISNTDYIKIDNPTAATTGAGLVLENAVVIRYKVAINDGLEGVVAKITCEGKTWEIAATEFVATGSEYYVYFAGLNSNQMSSEVLFTLYRDGVAISNTARYSIESYVDIVVATYGSYTEPANIVNLVNLVKEMLKYGDAARAY